MLCVLLMKKYYILLILLWCILWVGYFWWQKKYGGKKQTYISTSSPTSVRDDKKNDDKSIKKDVLQQVSTFDKRDEAILHHWKTWGDTWKNPEKFRETDMEQFTEVYKQAKKGNDAKRQLTILENLYEKKQVDQLLPFMIKLAIQLRNYEKALGRVGILESKNLLTTLLDDRSLFYLLFNGLVLTPENISRIKTLMLHYADQWYLDTSKLTVYESLIAYSKGDLGNYSYFMDQLTGTDYQYRYNNFQKNKKIVASFQDVPEYYLDALIARNVFQQWYWQVAKLAAKRLIKKDHEYILPRQLLLYTSLFLWQYDDVHEASNWLLEHDTDHEQLYNFLDAIAYFNQEDYANAILKFKNIRDERYFSDAKRYLLLSYVAIGDDRNTHESLTSLLQEDDLSPYDFYSIFDIFFYKPLREHQEFILFAKYFKTAKQYLDRCYKQEAKEYGYLCLYGKTGFLLADEQDEKAYQYLQRLIKWYPKWFIYEALGDIAYRLEKYTDAKKRFMQAVSVWNNDERKSLVEKVKKMVEGEEKN